MPITESAVPHDRQTLGLWFAAVGGILSFALQVADLVSQPAILTRLSWLTIASTVLCLVGTIGVNCGLVSRARRDPVSLRLHLVSLMLLFISWGALIRLAAKVA